jgi:hypothetical protein
MTRDTSGIQNPLSLQLRTLPYLVHASGHSLKTHILTIACRRVNNLGGKEYLPYSINSEIGEQNSTNNGSECITNTDISCLNRLLKEK